MNRNFAVALVDRRELALRNWTSVLSAREQAEAATFSNALRRQRTVASRVIAKYLMTQPDEAGFRWLSAAEVETAGGPEWPFIEVLSGAASNRVGTRIYLHGNAYTDWSASSSHCGPYTASLVARGRAGVDLERVEIRRPEFCANMFSAEERGWVLGSDAGGRNPSETGFTLLWTVKEAFLKASGRSDLSLWNFPLWTVRFDEAIEEILGRCEPFWSGPAAIFSREFSQSIGVAVKRVDEMILTAVWYSDSAARSSMDGRET